ncbi:MAG: hypothetical protein LBO09_01095 [Candidatus Peribacteria bacterium]|jgi:hypothetical protein|nr:hypothetical protein [Candidatus Peribacteria bacterium]
MTSQEMRPVRAFLSLESLNNKLDEGEAEGEVVVEVARQQKIPVRKVTIVVIFTMENVAPLQKQLQEV